MKKFIICLMMLCSFGAYATGENERVTSMGYVTEELETRQDKFDKLGVDNAMTYSGTTDGAVGSRTITSDLGAESNTSSTSLPTVGAVDTKLDNKQDKLDFAANTVLMNTGTAGEPAAKGIYDDSGSYAEQADSLIDVATFNAALQNAINSELSCAQRKDPNDPTSKCLLFNIFTPVAPSPNMFPAPINQTQTQNGVTVTVNGGVYSFSGTATADVTFEFELPTTYTPIASISHDGTGVMYLWNTIIPESSESVNVTWYDSSKQRIDAWTFYLLNRRSSSYKTQTGHAIKYVNVFIPNSTNVNDFSFAPMFVEDGVTTYTHFYPYGNTFLPQNVQ